MCIRDSSSIVSLPKGKVAVISGLKEYIVVDTDDVLMICPRAEEQNIKMCIRDRIGVREIDLWNNTAVVTTMVTPEDYATAEIQYRLIFA